jgi:hypothetical protein
MREVFKYPLNRDVILLPKEAEILHVGAQRDSLYVWALVDPSENDLQPRMRVAGTGHPIGNMELGKFHGTHILGDGSLVFHVWELPH